MGLCSAGGCSSGQVLSFAFWRSKLGYVKYSTAPANALAGITSLGLSVLKRVPSILANTLTKILRNSAGRTDPKA